MDLDCTQIYDGVCLLRVYRKVIMVDLSHLFAITLTLGAAVANASQNVFVRKGTDEGKPSMR